MTTGRKRRCGWFDVMVAKYSHLVNGYKSAALTKIDIFDTFEEVKIGVAYYLDRKKMDYIPGEWVWSILDYFASKIISDNNQ